MREALARLRTVAADAPQAIDIYNSTRLYVNREGTIDADVTFQLADALLPGDSREGVRQNADASLLETKMLTLATCPCFHAR